MCVCFPLFCTCLKIMWETHFRRFIFAFKLHPRVPVFSQATGFTKTSQILKRQSDECTSCHLHKFSSLKNIFCTSSKFLTRTLINFISTCSKKAGAVFLYLLFPPKREEKHNQNPTNNFYAVQRWRHVSRSQQCCIKQPHWFQNGEMESSHWLEMLGVLLNNCDCP